MTFMPELCYSCGDNPIPKKRYRNYDNDNNILCRKCWLHLIWGPNRNPIERHKEQEGLFHFRNTRFWFKKKMRTGRCSKCNNIIGHGCKNTNLHHWVYIIIFPWFGMEEICVSCHTTESWKLGQIR